MFDFEVMDSTNNPNPISVGFESSSFHPQSSILQTSLNLDLIPTPRTDDFFGEDEEDEEGEYGEVYWEIYAYAFYGCWEYEDYYVWVDIREDGTYEWVDGDNASSGSYTMEEDELVLDSGLRFSLDESGGLIDSDGDALFRSQLPDDVSGAATLSAA